MQVWKRWTELRAIDTEICTASVITGVHAKLSDMGDEFKSSPWLREVMQNTSNQLQEDPYIGRRDSATVELTQFHRRALKKNGSAR